MSTIANNSSTSEPQRILIVRLGAMGDVVHGLPVAAALRAMFPTAEIGWVIEERWAELLTSRPSSCGQQRGPQQPLVDKIHLVNTFAWRTAPLSDATWKHARSAVRGIRQSRYDVSIDLQGAWKSATLALLSDAPIRVGFRQPRERGASMFYNRPVIAAGTHIVEQNLSLLSVIDKAAEARTITPQLPVDEVAESWADQELARHGLNRGEFAIINPGAGWGAKCWPAERYAEVARGLAAQGLRSLINCGPGEDEIALAVEAASDGAAQPFRSTIGELTALLRRTRLFVGGDTGPMHLAAALRVPVTAIFGPTNPARNGPYATPAVVLRNTESITDHSRRAAPDEAMLSITAAEVLSAARALLDRTRPPVGDEVHRG